MVLNLDLFNAETQWPQSKIVLLSALKIILSSNHPVIMLSSKFGCGFMALIDINLFLIGSRTERKEKHGITIQESIQSP